MAIKEIPARRCLQILWCCVLWVLALNYCWAHPFHTTTAEMEFNASTRRFEVALKIQASDFEPMVRLGEKLSQRENVALEAAESHTTEPKTVSRKELQLEYLQRYIEHRFVILVAGTPCRLAWVGMEDEASSKWLYFELVLPDKTHDGGEMTLTNKVLCDHNNNQINTVVLLSKAGRVSLKSHEQSTTIALPRGD